VTEAASPADGRAGVAQAGALGAAPAAMPGHTAFAQPALVQAGLAQPALAQPASRYAAPRHAAPGRRRLNLSRFATGSVLWTVDVLSLLLAWPPVLWLAHPAFTLRLAPPLDLRAVLYPACDLLLLYAMGLYRREAILRTGLSLSRVPLVVGMGAVLALLLALVLAAAIPSCFAAQGGRSQAAGFAIAVTSFTACAFLARLVVDVLLQRQVLRRHLLVVGAGRRAWDLLRMLTKEGGRLNDAIAFLHHDSLGPIDPRLAADPAARIIASDTFAVVEAARALNADQVVIAPDERRGMDLEALLVCKTAGFPVVQYLSFVESEIRRVDLKRMELGWLLYSDGFQFSAIDRFLKRLFDLAASALVLSLSAPVLAAAVLAIRWEGPGPVLYRQERVTRGGRHFRILKLRTMRVDAEAAGAVWAARQDGRITRVGRFLRRTRIDELPQLVNVLRGEMSFVGPRPERPVFVAELARLIPLYSERHMVKAGLTGWAQINYPYGASVDDARSKLSYDLYYVKNFSVLFDLVILLQTLRVVLWPSGVR
jgi:sugar transferase (PEP-CTERM system associated)